MDRHSSVVYAFIDSQNLNLGVRSLGWELDFGRFRVYLKDKYNVKKAYLFLGYIKSNEKLYKYLRGSGYELVFKPTVRYKRNGVYVVKGNVDVELVISVMLEVENYDKCIIASGDGDFYSLIEYLLRVDKLYKIIVPNHSYSTLLKRFLKYIVNIEFARRKVEKKKEGVPSR
ncbi:NYN domain-containing protein [bacterium]|nr:NYN domain-containing protein [bacterium]